MVYYRGILERAWDAVAVDTDIVVGGSPARKQPENHAMLVSPGNLY